MTQEPRCDWWTQQDLESHEYELQANKFEEI